jgi:uncharacterized membrane protein YhiD involved in acid resistance
MNNFVKTINIILGFLVLFIGILCAIVLIHAQPFVYSLFVGIGVLFVACISASGFFFIVALLKNQEKQIEKMDELMEWLIRNTSARNQQQDENMRINGLSENRNDKKQRNENIDGNNEKKIEILLNKFDSTNDDEERQLITKELKELGYSKYIF